MQVMKAAAPSQNSIGELLLSYRKLHAMTQKDLAEKLSHFSEECKAINAVAISRWETGATEPSLKKKKIFLKFFAAEGCLKKGPCYELLRKQYEKLYASLSSVFTRRYQYLIGNSPDLGLDKNVSIHRIESGNDHMDEYLDHIIEIEKATNVPGYYTVTQETMKGWCQNPGTFAIVYERKKQHLGHFVMLKVKNSTAEAIAHNRRSELSITADDLCTPEEKGSYYIHALYGQNPKIAAHLNVEAYLFLFDHLDTIDNIVIFSSRTDGVELTKDYGIAMVAEGKDEVFGFTWKGMLSPVEDILFSDTVVKLIL